MTSKYTELYEEDLHIAVAEYLALAVPPRVGFWTTFPAGGGGEVRGRKLKRMGLKAGVPDIMLIRDGRVYFIELKAAKGRPSAEQISVWNCLSSNGAPVALCRDVGGVCNALTYWGFPVAARVAA
jgi:hypothetical protein